jgi:hypothetical protein
MAIARLPRSRHGERRHLERPGDLVGVLQRPHAVGDVRAMVVEADQKVIADVGEHASRGELREVVITFAAAAQPRAAPP